jgi:hypothetical protein
VQEAYLKASNTDASDQFGTSVSLDGDTLVVGATGEDSAARLFDGNQADNSSRDSGAAYVFRRTGTRWRQVAYLKPGRAALDSWFGASVSVDADTIAVGSRFARVDMRGGAFSTWAGAVHVFRRGGSTWMEEAYLEASNPGARHFFGAHLSLSADTLAVGATGESSAATGVDGEQSDDSALESGAVYVFRRSGTAWSQEAYLKASNTDALDSFGMGVGLDGDTLAVGAGGERSRATGVGGDQRDDSAENAGAVYVFRRSGTTWTQDAYLKASNAASGDWFGWSLSLSGDTLAVGAQGEASASLGVGGAEEDDSAPGAGAVYLFRRTEGAWSQLAYVKAPNARTGSRFGESVALTHDTLVVGASFEPSAARGVNGDMADESAPLSGAAYTFRIAR